MRPTHKDLVVWQISIDFVKRIYEITDIFPDSEQEGLGLQLKKMAIAIPSNIANGSARSTLPELLQCLSVALGAACELETLVILSAKLNFLDSERAEELEETANRISRMISALIKSKKTRLND